MLVSDQNIVTNEKHYILISNRKRCRKILDKGSKTNEDIVDFFISLHLVLETCLNAFYRQIILNKNKIFKKDTVTNNIDKINFIDKTIFFLYFSKFDFKDKNDKAKDYHSVIGKLRNFTEIRNKLLHGHMIGTVKYVKSHKITSPTLELINENKMDEQIELFKSIIDSISFYFDNMVSSYTVQGKEDIKKAFLSKAFLDLV